ncbi:MAG: hypothetical protein JO131_00550, partial [Gammaproteobacteria bacterium]|nr:hypothetical protein [Gammaproteobacteria bacterium]
SVSHLNFPSKILGQGAQKTVRKTWWLELQECYLLKNTSITDGLFLPYNAYIRNSTSLYYYDVATHELIRLKLSPATLASFDQALEEKKLTPFKNRKLTPTELTNIAKLINHSCPPSKICKTAGSVVKGKKNLEYFNNGKRIYEKVKHNPFILPMHYGAIYKGHGKDKGNPKSIFYSPRANTELFYLITEMDKFNPDLADILWITFSMLYGLKDVHQSEVILRDIKPENILLIENMNGISAYINDLDLGIKLEEAQKKPEIGSTFYVAFDRPIFNSVLQAHNNALSDLKNFDTPHFSIEKCTDEEQIIRYKKCKSILDSKSENAYSDYIEWYCEKAIAALKKSLKDPSIDFALSIIFNTLEPISCDNTPNHPKDDVWAMALVLRYLLQTFYDYDNQSSPTILHDLHTLVSNTLLYQRAVRPNANELFIAGKNLIENTLKQYENGEAKQQVFAKKFYSQLKAFKITLKEEKTYTSKTFDESIKQLPQKSLFKCPQPEILKELTSEKLLSTPQDKMITRPSIT